MLTCLILNLKLVLETSFLLRFIPFGCLPQIPFWNIWRFAQNYVLHRLAVQAEFRFGTFGYTGVNLLHAVTRTLHTLIQRWSSRVTVTTVH